jgi:8-oxo-dGTP pyrophosphatase MutT (NUDIX family)
MLYRILFFGYRVFCFIFRPILIGVRVMMIQNEQVLLVSQTYLPGWYMPGGGLKRGETLEQAARREAREEAGAELGELRLVGIYTTFEGDKSDHNALFLCRDFILGGKPDGEIVEARFFDLNDLPDGLMPGHRRRLEEFRAGIVSPQFGKW